MITQADDHGRLPADPGQLRLLAFGYDEDVTIAKVSDWLAEIAATGLIGLYTVRDVPYAYFPSWEDHQKIDRPSGPKHPPPPELRSTRPRRTLADASSKTRRGSKDQGSKDQGSKDLRLAIAVEEHSTSTDHILRRPARGEYLDIAERMRRNHPELAESEIQDKATREFQASLHR